MASYELEDLIEAEEAGGLEEELMVRLKPYKPEKGFKVRRYHIAGMLFREDRGWYKTSDLAVLKLLAQQKQDAYEEEAKPIFDIVDQAEAAKIDARERKPGRAEAGEPNPLPAVRGGGAITTREAVTKPEQAMIDGADGEPEMTPEEIEALMQGDAPKAKAPEAAPAKPAKTGRRAAR